jgi:hypothetical protein
MPGRPDMILLLDAQDRRAALNAASKYQGLTPCDEGKDEQGESIFDQWFQKFSRL